MSVFLKQPRILKRMALNQILIIFHTVFLRANKIDFKNWDVQLEKHLTLAWSMDTESHTRSEEWEIELVKLEIEML